MPLRFSLLPVEEKFFGLFEESAKNAVVAVKLFKEIFDGADVAQKTAEITEVEQKSDRFTHEIIQRLHRTFVTPFDREDMAKLASSLDDIVDYIEGAAVRMHLYKAERPLAKARELAETIVKCTEAVEEAVSLLKDKAGLKKIMDETTKIHALEYEADGIYRAAIAEIFNSPDLLYIMKWHEIYQYMEDTTDRCEDVADVLEGVVLKNA